ncbi:MAG: radical SAM protein [Bacillota bacterium]
MKFEKIALIEPQASGGHVFSKTHMPRLGLPILGTQLKELGYAVAIYVGPASSLPWEEILEADLVGISAITPTSREAYRIAAYLRHANIPVVIGGIHATFLPDEAMQYADYVVRGEADFTFPALVACLHAGKSPQEIPGISYRDGEEIIHNPCATEWVNINELPIPDLSLFVRGGIRRGAVPVMTSRGCPFNCTFCSVTPMFGRGYRYRSTENVLQELSRYSGRHIFFCDDNFAANRRRSLELLQGIIDRKIKIRGWGAQMRVEASRDDELMAMMRRTGCHIVYLGLESINADTLKAYNKKQSVEDIADAIRRYHAYGMRVHGMFVLGGDDDTVETIRETVDFALRLRIDTVQFLMLTPLPGTPLFEKLEREGRLLTRDWELYDGHHAVFQPARMTAEQLQEETVRAFQRFYAPAHIMQNFFFTGWPSALYRGVGWMLVRRFVRENRCYRQFLEQFQNEGRRVPLLYRRVQTLQVNNRRHEPAGSHLKIFIAENRGIFYVRLRGFLDRLTLKEMKRSLQGHLPARFFQLVVDTKELSFASDKASRSFSRLLDRLQKRAHRLQLIYSAGERPRFLSLRQYFSKLSRFELLPHKR